MLGVIMALSFVFPFAGSLAIRRFQWIGAWLGLILALAGLVVFKISDGAYDEAAFGFMMVLVFLPTAIGATLGSGLNAFRRWRMGPGELATLNIILAIIWTFVTVWWAILMTGDL